MERIFLVGAAVLTFACSAGGGGSSLSGSSGSGASSGTGTGGTTTVATVGAGGGSGGEGDLVAEVYGHSASELYKLDPLTHEVTVVGPFNGCSQVIDIAIDKDHNMYGTTDTGLYAINRTNAACTFIASGDYPNSLSFVPAGTVDPNEEALVGYFGSDYVRIDKQTGNVTNIGSVTSGYSSSGDIVSVKGGGTYVTVKSFECSDCILEVNPSTGDLIQELGPVGAYTDVFGLTFWGGKAYGFSDDGELFEVTFMGGNVTTTIIPIPNAPQSLSFWGAGSSTSAPVNPVE